MKGLNNKDKKKKSQSESNGFDVSKQLNGRSD